MCSAFYFAKLNAKMPLSSIQSSDDFDKFLTDAGNNPVVVYFYADAAASECEVMENALNEMLKKPEMKNVLVAKIDAEKNEDLAGEFEVTAVPTFVLVRGKEEQHRIEGANAPELNQKLSEHVLYAPPTSVQTTREPNSELNDHLKKLINADKVVLFMKGSPTEPRCGFSRTITGLLNENKVNYSYFDILKDEEVRQGLKTFSDWPTYPQLYVKGELIGGVDIVKEMAKNGELKAIVPRG